MCKFSFNCLLNSFFFLTIAYAVFQAALIHVYNCTSSDQAVAQTSREYIRICINDCLVPLTNDIPHAPPVIQFLENLLRLMKADISVMKHSSSDKSTHQNNSHGKMSSSSSDNNNNSTNQQTSSNTPLSVSSASNYHSKLPTTSLQSEPPLSYISSVPNSTSSPMSVYQIVSGMQQPTPSPMQPTLQGTPNTMNSDSHPNNNSNSNNNPINLINLALTDDPLLNNNNQENPMMTQAAWQYLFSSAGTPFINNNNRNNANIQGNQIYYIIYRIIILDVYLLIYIYNYHFIFIII